MAIKNGLKGHPVLTSHSEGTFPYNASSHVSIMLVMRGVNVAQA